jgi:hypothetical protein
VRSARSGSLFARFRNAGLILCLQIVRLFLSLARVADGLICGLTSLLKNLVDRFEQEFLDQKQLDHQVKELGDHSPRHKCYQWLCIHIFPP